MENVMTNGFAELSAFEMEMIDGGVNWDRVFAGTTVYAGATLAICMATGPIGVGAAAAYIGISAISGAYVGYGFSS